MPSLCQMVQGTVMGNTASNMLCKALLLIVPGRILQQLKRWKHRLDYEQANGAALLAC